MCSLLHAPHNTDTINILSISFSFLVAPDEVALIDVGMYRVSYNSNHFHTIRHPMAPALLMHAGNQDINEHL